MLPSLSLSPAHAVLLLLGLFAVETTMTLLVNPKEQLEIVRHSTEDNFTQNKAQTLRGRAATFAGFSIAIATFLFSTDRGEPLVAQALQFVWLTLGFLLLSYQLKALHGLNRFWINMQEKMFEYGFLSLLGVLFTLSNAYGASVASTFLKLSIGLVVVFRFYAVGMLLYGLWGMWKRNDEDSRRGYLVGILRDRYAELRGRKGGS
jgi:hypothetical protein